MEYVGYALLAILALLLLLILCMIIKTLLNKPKKDIKDKVDDLIEVDANVVAKQLSEAIQCKTVSMEHGGREGDDDTEFLKFQKFLNDTYPTFMKKAKLTKISTYSLIYYIEGSDKSLKPACFLSHQDVVPAPVESWEVPPFDGVIKDGYVWGRGAQDMKSQLIATIYSLELLLKQGYKPKRSIYCCFGHDEEPTTKLGAPYIVKHFQEKGIQLELVFDEGGAIVDGKQFGIDSQIAMIGTAEKGYVDFRLISEVRGGHASTPGKKTAVGNLAKAVDKLMKNQMAPRWTVTSQEMFDTLSPHMSFPLKFLFTNRKILKGFIRRIMGAVSPMTSALFRTTMAPTMLSGSEAPNVLPTTATAIINSRIVTGETVDDVKAHIESVVGKDIKVEVISANNPTPPSITKCEPFEVLSDTIKEVFPGMIPAPFLFIAASDARYYFPVCDHIYRFTPFIFSDDDRTRIHSMNERVKVADLEIAVQFMAKFITNMCS